ncbi:MAG: PD40 domain-containing protein [Polyangiaceae bacterium]|nr:PD40 domain-containing protein [Polyangiaceae bacterium]
MLRPLRASLLLLCVCAVPVGAALSCSADGSGGGPSSGPGTGGAGGATGTGGAGGSVFTGTGGNGGPYTDFPADPVIDPSAPADAPALFAPAGDPSGGPCLFEPEPDTLFPRNWLRPRFRFTPGPGQNLFEIRLHTENEVNDLVVYTASTSWTMPKPMWEGLASHILDAPITMTIRGATYNGSGLDGPPSAGNTGTFTIAPADAAGAIVYWTTSGGSLLKGFKVGDESVAASLAPPDVAMPTVNGAQVTCIGCHTSTPDGKFVGFTAQGPWGNALASIEEMTAGDVPSFMGPGALAALAALPDLGIQTYSKAHWQPGDHVMVTPFGSYASAQLAWVDLEAQASGQGAAYGFIARNGDPRGAGAPTWSHDGQTIVYVSTDVEFTGRLDNGYADLYAVPYNDRAGGAAAPIPGASDPGQSEYYPAFSPDDAWIAFNRAPSGNNMYNQPLGEVLVIPAAGGSATRVAANDPVACTGKSSPGVTNSWPKWAPEATTVGDRTFYWLIFSSTRGALGNPQLYITGVEVQAGAVKTHGALYLWNQPEGENNHTPAWDVFKIPPADPPE